MKPNGRPSPTKVSATSTPAPELKYRAATRMIEQLARELGCGQQLPSEAQLGSRLKVSRITIRRAMDELEQQGIIERRQGSGTFVLLDDPADAPAIPPEVINPLGFHAQMTTRGHRVSSQVISYRRIGTAPHSVASALALPPATPVMRLVRLRFLDGSIHHLTTAWWDPKVCRLPLNEDSEKLATDSLYAMFRAQGISLHTEEIAVYQSVPSGDQAKLLGLTNTTGPPENPGIPRITSDSTVFDATGQRIIFSRTLRKSLNAVVSFCVTGSVGSSDLNPMAASTLKKGAQQ